MNSFIPELIADLVSQSTLLSRPSERKSSASSVLRRIIRKRASWSRRELTAMIRVLVTLNNSATLGSSSIRSRTSTTRKSIGFVAKFWEEATQARTSRLSVNLG